MTERFAKLTSAHDTSLYVEKDAVLMVEGYTYPNDHEKYPNHVGSRLTLKAGQWTDVCYCIEDSDAVVRLLQPWG